MMSETTRKIVDFAYDDQAKEARDQVYAEIHDRVMAHLDAQKQIIAKSVLADEQPNQEENGENV